MKKDYRSDLAKARDEWFESEEGQRCSSQIPKVALTIGPYLRNRLELAFLAGAAAERRIAPKRN